ncbi:hypothetical protein MRB53_006235 [Persea americana]|uniref:Uncharacterized protein n=1 Tax=Persea americana TaxID=3435 RepID=A0ACC2MFE5_PERAE|nr:hypothetical protein MRB53_006235 [Persea americana]
MAEFHLYLFLSSETGNLMHGSISTDSVSINEKNGLKDNLNADNLNLELEVVKPEMVESSSRDVPAIGGDLHSLGDQEPGENQGSMEEIHDTNAATADLIKKNESTDAGSPEKLNLDPNVKGDYDVTVKGVDISPNPVYKNWIRHGEEYVSCHKEEIDEIEVDDMSETDPMITMLNDIACGLAPEYTSCETEEAGGSNPHSGADGEVLRYFEILDDAQTELYPGCKDFSILSFIIELLHLKALNQWSDTSFDMLL